MREERKIKYFPGERATGGVESIHRAKEDMPNRGNINIAQHYEAASKQRGGDSVKKKRKKRHITE